MLILNTHLLCNKKQVCHKLYVPKDLGGVRFVLYSRVSLITDDHCYNIRPVFIQVVCNRVEI